MKISTCIPGLDELTDGGFLENSVVLVSGIIGSGKTIMGMQYVFKGAEQFSEPGVIVTLEEGPTNIWWIMRGFHWNLTKMEEKGLIKLYRVKPDIIKLDEEIDKITDICDDINAKRLLIDSTTIAGLALGEVERKHFFFKLIDRLKSTTKCTPMVTTKTERINQLSQFGIEELIADTVITLYHNPPIRALEIWKMRGSRHDEYIRPFEITSDGIIVKPGEEVKWEALVR